MRAIVLAILAIALSGCATEQVHRKARFHDDPRVHRNPDFYNTYRPPNQINRIEFGSSVTEQPENIQLIGGEGFEYRRGRDHKIKINYASYFNPADTSPFTSPARASSIEYLYCMFGDKPTLCGAKIVYESEEVYDFDDRLSKIRRTNHELIIEQLIAEHGPPEYSGKYAQTIIEEEQGIHRGWVPPVQRRVWCDFSGGVPKQCNRSIISLFTGYTGRGVIVYLDEKLYKYLRWFEEKLKHPHPAMAIIAGETNDLDAEEIAWWESRLTRPALGYIPRERLYTEIQLEARARASGKPRPKITRKLTQKEFVQESVSAYVNFADALASNAEQHYWYGYTEGILARDFDHQFHLTDEAREKWATLAAQWPETTAWGSRGYFDALSGKHNPPARCFVFEMVQGEPVCSKRRLP